MRKGILGGRLVRYELIDDLIAKLDEELIASACHTARQYWLAKPDSEDEEA